MGGRLKNKMFKNIEKIKINKQDYYITIIEIECSIGNYYTAYVYLDNANFDDDLLSNCTFHQDNIYGVDTMHYYNQVMKIEEKYDDAIRQIKELIKSYNKKQKE